ncbi:Putative uncharacterized protein [Taphrina deformans PYCC 5710]|uniref:CPAF-like PDZ domain-containing protein n=1 Tax=Taphrina deformans (strain PYCC 5710 / ATCC 11124 / CBS 356.35 / IMI 108563 / JCM 9778 / NBRC 8474) TaxID=1097556 RepID=R4XBP9_TAPDE|nr:Putative uncharacterized protein [Taphrina deformans PYCC 5710]|eukprot:CCG83290.1 Putative uncharacterized protein [Taphrina deformans PYCC 5710]
MAHRVLPAALWLIQCRFTTAAATTESGFDNSCLALSTYNSSRFPESFVRPSEINACMAEIAMNKTAAQDLLKGMDEMLDLYSYEGYTANSHNAQLPLHVDIRSGLQNFRDTLDQYRSLPEFTRKVTGLVNSLYDGHTVLAADCSGRISYDAFLPLSYHRRNDESPPKVYVHPDYDQFLLDRKINRTEQFDLQKSLAGAEVLAIDGQEVERYLTDLVSNTDILFGNIDPQTRWNQLFVNLRGHPTPRLGYGVALTSLSRAFVDKDDLNVSVLFANDTRAEIVLPWLGTVDSDYSKVKEVIQFKEYYTKYVCMAGNSTLLLASLKKETAMGSRARAVDLETVHRQNRRRKYPWDQEYDLVRDAPLAALRLEDKHDRAHSDNGTVLASAKSTIPGPRSQLELLANVDSGFQIYHFRDTTVGVVYYTNFADDDEHKAINSTKRGERYHDRYARDMAKGLQELKRRGVDTLLMDVSGNNGGQTELGSLAMLSLFPATYPGFGSVLRTNQEMRSFVDGSDYPGGFSAADGQRYRSYADLFASNNRTYSINGGNFTYTQLSVDNLIDHRAWPIIGNATFPQSNLFSPKDMMIVSNGKCASTCAQLTMYYQDVHGIKSAGFGGMPNSSHLLQTVGGVRGAQVVDMLDEDPSQNMYNFTMKVSQLTINFRSAIHYQARIPTEYVTRNVDFPYHHTRETYNSFENTWRLVAMKHFPRAMSRLPTRRQIATWRPLVEYPVGWFDGVQQLQSAMDKPGEEVFPKKSERADMIV